MNRKQRRSMGTMNVEVIVHYTKAYGVRMWLAGKLIRLAEIVGSQTLTFSIKESNKGDKS